MVKFSTLETICDGIIVNLFVDRQVTAMVIDSRKSIASEEALFFAIRGERHDGHKFISDLYAAGFRQFVIEKPVDVSGYPEANFLQVESSLKALQSLAANHRSKFSIPVIGITGSNGKTIIKEWLYQLLSPDYIIVKNPGSYNSQVGVPLSVWQIQKHHQLGIFEAGISKVGEMKNLQKIIQPTIGIFTTLGPAHSEGFESRTQKIREKLRLFDSTNLLVYCKDQSEVSLEIERAEKENQTLLSWGADPDAAIQISKNSESLFTIKWNGKNFTIQFPFSDRASIENVGHCIAIMLYFDYSEESIQERITQLKTVPMRLELRQGINQCQIIDDTYNNDLAGLQIGLDFLAGLQKKKSTVILSDILESGQAENVLVNEIAELVRRAGVNSFIGIGPLMLAQPKFFEDLPATKFFESTEDFLNQIDWNNFQQEAILVKGARVFQFERIVRRLQKKIHGTVVEIDLGAMVHNLNFFKAKLKPGVKLMVMVKAFAYGSGSEEVANLLQYHHVDYLGVAYPDEGVELRKNHIRLPIMVMNPSEESFETLVTHQLEPEIFSIAILRSLTSFLNGRPYKIHIELDTGMHRLGFEESDLSHLIAILRANPNVEVASVFSHLAAADETTHDAFTKDQANFFLSLAAFLTKELNIHPTLHILNSSGILRFPELQLDMVRLGIGLYGVDPTEGKESHLQVVATLKTIISQIKRIKAGESIGYGRKGLAEKETMLATIAIGYADGFSRSFSQGIGSVWIHGELAPVIGNVCMDMTMVDITGIPAKEGDEVIVFGKELTIDSLAKKINTIPYEVLTGTSERVRRIFYAESI